MTNETLEYGLASEILLEVLPSIPRNYFQGETQLGEGGSGRKDSIEGLIDYFNERFSRFVD